MTNGTRIIIDNFQCHDALRLFDMPVYLLETGRAPNWTEVVEATLADHARAILLKTRPSRH
jgi:hypothetical protein